MVDLEKIQEYELNILVYIDEICRKNQIRYYLGFGTLIGAIRHHGFIPWDDDIDILMPRPDYERFIDVMNSQEFHRYKMCCIENEKEWTAPLAKVIDTKTKLNQTGHREKMDLGLYIDVFVIDGLPEDYTERKRLYKKLDRLQKFWGACEHRNRPLNSGQIVKNSMKNMISVVMNIFSSARGFSEKINNILKEYPYDTSKFVGVNGYMPYPRESVCVPKEVFGEGCEVAFEGHGFIAPAQYDLYLKKIYGDYMKLPSESERVAHHKYTLEFLE